MAGHIYIKEKNFSKIKNQVKESLSFKKKPEFIFSSEDDELNRKVLEKIPEIDILLIPLKKRKDFMKQRNSGFNHVMAKEAKKNNISIGVDFDEIIEAENAYEKSKVLSRIIQNVFLCNKNGIKMVFISEKYERNPKDLKSLGLVLGMPTWMTKSLKLVGIDRKQNK